MPEARRRFAVVRPYPGSIGRRIAAFVAELGFEGSDELIVPTGVPDGEAAVWAGRQEVGLLVLPFHVHKDRHGEYVDGTGVAALLSPAWARHRIPILMPVTRFSWSARFPRRFEELQARRPEIAELVVPVPESRIGDVSIRDEVSAIARGEPVSGAGARPR